MTAFSVSGIQHLLRFGDYEASIASVGATVRQFTHMGRDLVVAFAAEEVRPSFRGATLAPWPNRIVDGRYTFGGTDYQVALSEPARSHALHGLASWLDFEPVDKGASHVTLAATIEPQSGYPWRIRVEAAFVLGEDGLTQHVTAMNLSAQDAPWGTSAHPYLVAGPGRVDDWMLEVPASQLLEVTNDRLIPTQVVPVDATDPKRFDFRETRAIGAVKIDHAYTGLLRDDSGIVTVRVLHPDGGGVAMSWDAACPWVQIHTADKATPELSRLGMAVEPMTCAPDAFNAESYSFDTGLITLPAGETAQASWRISAL